MRQSRAEELERLIAEQARDDKYKNKQWPQFPGMISIDALHDLGIDFDQDGHFARHNHQLLRNAPKRTKGRAGGARGERRRKESCPKHPGEFMRSPSGRGWCRGCQRDYDRKRFGYTRTKRRKIEGPRTKADVAKTKRAYTKRTKEYIAAYQAEYYQRHKAEKQAYGRERYRKQRLALEDLAAGGDESL